MLDRVLWNGWFRFIAFLVIFALTTILFDLLVPWLDLPWLWDHLVSVVRNFTYQSPTPWFGWGQHVAVAQLSSPGLATNLAWTIGAIGAGLLTGYLVMHVLVFLVSLRALRRRVKRYGTRREFAEAYDLAVHAYLQQHPLIGHAWKEFDETLLNGERRIDGAIGNTVRPQAFINLALIRERLPGLKLLPSISGYFVGAGLLLTFIGIVLALGIAAGSVESGNAEQMQIAMTRLLHTASFKFATSIAGLGVSILFAIFARLIVICVEGGLNRFCDAVEHQLLYVAPQFIAAESNRVVKEQLVELKELSSERYFSNFAQILEEAMQRTLGGISGRMEVAISGAATQVGRAVTEAIAPLTGGVADVIRENTGNELQQLGRTLAALEGALGNMQAGLDRLDTALGEAAAGASGRMEAAMEGVLKQLQQQVGVFLEGMRDQGDAAARELAGARQQAAAAQAEATAGITRAGQEAARALNEGLGNVLQRIEDSVNRLDNALQRSAEAHQAQAAAVNDSSAGAQRLAEAFSETAERTRTALVPLQQAGERLSLTSSQLGDVIEQGVAGFKRAGDQSGQLAEALREQVEQLTDAWENYRAQFDQVDRALATAVAGLAAATESQSARLHEYVVDVDRSIANVLSRLQPAFDDIGNSAAQLAETLQDLVGRLPEPAQ